MQPVPDAAAARTPVDVAAITEMELTASSTTGLITIGNQWRTAIDRPVKELGDYLVHRLGIQR